MTGNEEVAEYRRIAREAAEAGDRAHCPRAAAAAFDDAFTAISRAIALSDCGFTVDRMRLDAQTYAYMSGRDEEAVCVLVDGFRGRHAEPATGGLRLIGVRLAKMFGVLEVE